MAPQDPLLTRIDEIKGVGPKLGQLFAKKGISTFEDAVYSAPRAYEDRRRLVPMAKLIERPPRTSVVVCGKVVSARAITRGFGARGRGRGRQMSFEVVLSDGTGSALLYWFKAYPSMQEEFKAGETFLVYGELDFFGGRPRLSHPEYERARFSAEGKPVASFSFGRVVPLYSETEGLHQKVLRRVVGEALRQSIAHLEEPLPEEMRERLALPGLRQSLTELHYPPEPPEEGKLPESARRVIFEEFFVLHLGLGLKRQRRRHEAPVLADERTFLRKLLAQLPFPLTGDQQRAIDDVRRDLATDRAMARLVQGDVGAGKTVIALAGAALAGGSGCQTVMMAPTEILAQQHFQAAKRWLEPAGVEPVLLVASTSKSRDVRRSVADGTAGFVVGTHAVFQEAIEFARLGLVVVDEQHRFGVEQRAALLRKGKVGTPHLLMMTATPIPRTLALTVFGDLDVTILKEKPAGRQPVTTTVVRDRERPRLYTKIRETIARGEQVYIIYPLVEDSEKLDLKSASAMHERLSREIFPDLSVALLHGRMKAEEKDRILAAFRDREYHILISTTVIEVGIDVANATLMVIEHPERLGLSQLHQLRGRVGRGKAASECILVADDQMTARLKVMERSDDGFEIAEEDLRLRGPGEFLGTRQSGLPGFRVAHLVRDNALLLEARQEADRILAADPGLARPEHAALRAAVESRWKEKIERLRSG